jgi:hypothetical protein
MFSAQDIAYTQYSQCLLYVPPGLKSSHFGKTVYVSILYNKQSSFQRTAFNNCSLEGTNRTAIHNGNQFQFSAQQMDTEILPAKQQTLRWCVQHRRRFLGQTSGPEACYPEVLMFLLSRARKMTGYISNQT